MNAVSQLGFQVARIGGKGDKFHGETDEKAA
jgi:hypothetical protein